MSHNARASRQLRKWLLIRLCGVHACANYSQNPISSQKRHYNACRLPCTEASRHRIRTYSSIWSTDRQRV